MKVAPTLDSGLKIEAEVPGDWDVLRCILSDACAGETDLASRLAQGIEEPEAAEDWENYVVPELREKFGGQLFKVERAIESAAAEFSGQPGTIYIPPEDLFSWYGALNQARLGLEARYGFGPVTQPDLTAMSIGRRSGFLRGRFYTAVQSIMLDHLM